MTAGSTAPPGKAYVIRRDKAPAGAGPGPVFVTRRGAELQLGAFTTNEADARRWRDRAAAWRFLQNRPSLTGWRVTTIAGPTPEPMFHPRRRRKAG